MVAGSVTFLRILALVAVFAPILLVPLVWPMLAMAVTGCAGAILLHVISKDTRTVQDEVPNLGNPLKLTTALGFGGLLAVVLIAVHFLRAWLGTEGVYTAAMLSGIADVDALTISVARLVMQDLPVTTGANAIFIVASVNTVLKAAIAFFVGATGLGLRVSAVYVATIAAGATCLALVTGT